MWATAYLGIDYTHCDSMLVSMAWILVTRDSSCDLINIFETKKRIFFLGPNLYTASPYCCHVTTTEHLSWTVMRDSVECDGVLFCVLIRIWDYNTNLARNQNRYSRMYSEPIGNTASF